MTKSIQLLGALALMLVFSTEVKAQSLQEEMFGKFGTLTEWMNTPMINSYIEESAELNEEFYGLLDETAVSDSKIIPLGKVEKGKSVILLYLVAEYTDEGKMDFFMLHAATLNQKTGEKTSAEKYLLAGGTRGESTYNGSYKLKEKGLIVISQNEVNTETDSETVVVKEYAFRKELEFMRTID
ncbi:MAG: hypothetical protein ACI837_003427 [Crocinitomicaceae bacterium]|jgi:hypothetical protein